MNCNFNFKTNLFYDICMYIYIYMFSNKKKNYINVFKQKVL